MHMKPITLMVFGVSSVPLESILRLQTAPAFWYVHVNVQFSVCWYVCTHKHNTTRTQTQRHVCSSTFTEPSCLCTHTHTQYNSACISVSSCKRAAWCVLLTQKHLQFGTLMYKCCSLCCMSAHSRADAYTHEHTDT